MPCLVYAKIVYNVCFVYIKPHTKFEIKTIATKFVLTDGQNASQDDFNFYHPFLEWSIMMIVSI